MFLFEKNHRANGGQAMDGSVANAFWVTARDSAGLKLPWESGPQAGVFAKRRRVDDGQIFLRHHSFPPSHGSMAFDLLDD